MSHWTPTHEDGDTFYRLQTQAYDQVVELPHGGKLLVYSESCHDTWLRFAVLEWESSNSDSTDVRYRLVFHGEGATGVLRELRHTWWGGESENPGYVFYPSVDVITAALVALREWFDA